MSTARALLGWAALACVAACTGTTAAGPGTLPPASEPEASSGAAADIRQRVMPLPYRSGPLASFARARTEELVAEADVAVAELFLLRLALQLEGGEGAGPHRLALAYDAAGLHLVLFEPRRPAVRDGAAADLEAPLQRVAAVREVAEAFLVELLAARAAASYPPLSGLFVEGPPLSSDVEFAERLAGATLSAVEVEAWAVVGRRADGARVLLEPADGGPVITALP